MSNTETNTLHYPSPDIRIVQLDVMRGAAVLGIYWINVMVAALPHSAYLIPVLLGDATTANNMVWAFSEVFVDGTMRGLFSMLFGASAMLFLDESRLAGKGLEVVDRYYRRSLLLMLFGMLHAWLLLWPNDVLYAYGLFGLFLFPLRKLAPQVLLVLGLVLLALGDMGVAEIQPAADPAASVSTQLNKAPDLTDSGLSQTIANQMDETISTFRAGYWRIFDYQKQQVVEQQSTNIYNSHFFDIGGMMLIGMALFRLGILIGRRTRSFYLQMTVMAYLCGMLFRGPETLEAFDYGFKMTRLLGHEGETYNIGRLAMGLGHIGLICLLCQTVLFEPVARMLAAVGRLALSNYIMQSILSMFIFYGFGLGLYGQLERYQLLFICLAVWVVQIIFSLVWLKHFHYGPLEWLWRSLIYGRKQRFLRVSLTDNG